MRLGRAGFDRLCYVSCVNCIYFTDGCRLVSKDNLEDVGRGIAMLKDMALDMGNTIEDQNDRIGRITNKVGLRNCLHQDFLLVRVFCRFIVIDCL